MNIKKQTIFHVTNFCKINLFLTRFKFNIKNIHNISWLCHALTPLIIQFTNKDYIVNNANGIIRKDNCHNNYSSLSSVDSEERICECTFFS